VFRLGEPFSRALLEAHALQLGTILHRLANEVVRQHQTRLPDHADRQPDHLQADRQTIGSETRRYRNRRAHHAGIRANPDAGGHGIRGHAAACLWAKARGTPRTSRAEAGNPNEMFDTPRPVFTWSPSFAPARIWVPDPIAEFSPTQTNAPMKTCSAMSALAAITAVGWISAVVLVLEVDGAIVT
jgi:hypothetical protein